MKISVGKVVGAVVCLVGVLIANVWLVMAGLVVATFIEVEVE